jgi:peptidoglycan/LPS O-acetylase OafA/YrhL
MKYRSEIDGLRALAVLPVILFHAGFEWFGGGFVGVDVFFVISGYLITTIMNAALVEFFPLYFLLWLRACPLLGCG